MNITIINILLSAATFWLLVAAVEKLVRIFER